jgi:hypothetical protein
MECRLLSYLNKIFFCYIYLYFIYFCWTFMASFNRRIKTLTVKTLSSAGQPRQVRHNSHVGISIILFRNNCV